MGKIYTNILLLFIITFTINCKANVNIGVLAVRSGNTENDNIEEPLGKLSVKYENALNISNAIIESLIKKDYNKITSNYIQNGYTDQLSASNIQEVMDKAKQSIGDIESYKTMQWGFVSKKVNGNKLLYSIKIMKHQNALVHYLFVFKDDGQYNGIIGFHIKARTGIRKTNEI